jgi:deazaflavin-dependent oxidoreductase (nitroreductase family)
MRTIDEFAELQVLYLTTTGRITGKPRTIEIWFVVYQKDLYVLAEHYHRANWVQNIKMNPVVNIRIGDHNEMAARARILDPRLDSESWRSVQALAIEKYGWGDGLPVQLSPTDDAGPGK